MAIFLSILRGINVSGQKIIKMADLKVLYENMGFKNVTTYIQSGNVIFQTTNSKNLAEKIDKQIHQQYNFNVPILILTLEEIQEAISGNPFLKEKNIELDKLHVTFLSNQPTTENVDKIKDLNHQHDRFYLSGNVIYIYCPGGYGSTKLNNNFFENKLKVTATTRNWKTVNELFKIMQS